VHAASEGAIVMVPQDAASLAAAQQRLLYRKGRGKHLINIEEPVSRRLHGLNNSSSSSSRASSSLGR
jgi:hypothetical protein